MRPGHSDHFCDQRYHWLESGFSRLRRLAIVAQHITIKLAAGIKMIVLTPSPFPKNRIPRLFIGSVLVPVALRWAGATMQEAAKG